VEKYGLFKSRFSNINKDVNILFVGTNNYFLTTNFALHQIHFPHHLSYTCQHKTMMHSWNNSSYRGSHSSEDKRPGHISDELTSHLKVVSKTSNMIVISFFMLWSARIYTNINVFLVWADKHFTATCFTLCQSLSSSFANPRRSLRAQRIFN